MVLGACRDALAVLRRQYGFEASPSKRKRKLLHADEEDGLALEQVSLMLYHNSYFVSSHNISVVLLQMIVGVLLFTPLLFLLPTTFVYYILVLVLHTFVLGACWALQTLSQLLHRNPAYFLWSWAANPGIVPGKSHPLSC